MTRRDLAVLDRLDHRRADGLRVGARRQRLDEVHHRADVPGHAGGQAGGDQLPVAVHEDVGEHALEDHHGHHDAIGSAIQ